MLRSDAMEPLLSPQREQKTERQEYIADVKFTLT